MACNTSDSEAPIVGWEIVIVDGTHLCLLPSAEQLPSPSVDGCKIVPALHLRHVQRFLSAKRIRLYPHNSNDADDAQSLESNKRYAVAKNADDADTLMSLITDINVHRHSNIQYATCAGMHHAFVDCNDGILIHHDASKSKSKNLDGGGIKVSLKRPRSTVSAAVTAETTRSDGNGYATTTKAVCSSKSTPDKQYWRNIDG